MLLLSQHEIGFVPNVVGSIVAVHIQGRSMNWGFRRYALSLCHPTIANVMFQSWGCLFAPQRIP